MMPALALVDFLVFLCCLRKGFPGTKIKAEVDILKNFGSILKKYKEIESKKIIPDRKIIESFTDGIFLPQNMTNTKNDSGVLKYFSKLSRITKRWIFQFV